MNKNPLIAAALAASVACAARYHDAEPIAPDQLWSPLPTKTVVVDGMEIATVDSGGDGPPVVLIHGLSSYTGFWEYQIPHLAKTHRVLALDLPGYGASSRPDAPCTPPWYADVVDAWMDELGVDSATVMGHSMGGQIAMTLALNHPDRVNGLVLAAPAGIETFSRGEAAMMKRYWTEDRAMHASEQVVRANMIGAVFNRADDGVERLIEERVRLGKHPAFEGTSVAVSRSIAGMVDWPVRDRLGQIGVPTLIVFGTADKMIPNPLLHGGRTLSIGEAARDAISGSRLVMIPGAGHTVHHDAPDVFNTEASAFLSQLQ